MNTRSRRSASVTSTGTRWSARLAGAPSPRNRMITTLLEPACSHPYDDPLCELSYPEGNDTESQEIEASSRLALQPTIYDYSAPEDGVPSTSQLPDHPPPQPRAALPLSTTTARALLKRITKLRDTLDNESDSDDSSDSDSDSDPDADAPEAEEEDTRHFYATHLGDEVDGAGAPQWYAPAKGQAWAFYQQRKDIAHCARLLPHTEMVLKNIEASCVREKLLQDRLLVYFREYMAAQEGESQTLPMAPATSSLKEIYGVTVPELREEVERNRVRLEREDAKQSSSSTGSKRPREEEEEEEVRV
ncbi:hypothetical protein BDZ89DRAFT_1064055 [Hymenopellis radicata]|nr:hypothetical protein BDZ89DRAFT_1064055 [Hymenopellis radicata]